MTIKRYRYIAFEGPMACGKRELAQHVSKALNAEYISDLKDNPFLASFYKNKAGAAFQAQLFFLLNRYQILQGLKQPSLFHQVIISDFMLDKDKIYAYQNLSDSELMLYEKLNSLLRADVVEPDLVIYLQMSPDRLYDLMKKQNSGLFTISEEYVETVVEGYNRFFFHFTKRPLIIVNANEVRFDRDRVALTDLLSFLDKEHRGVTYFTPQTG